VRNINGAFFRYAKGTVPTDAKDLIVFLERELLDIQTSLNELADGYLEFITVPPPKPREGMLRNANAGILGVNKGTYCYYNSTWNYLG
jgi:hypothetical protein